ncbi:stage V sporulation protein B [Virgibacillus pantothenticus]|uniref:Stage V sporulation protein B n=1 Tax=Virgibacillus pantothenticus TaxID=1473 RepID=A0A0L0QPT6_VIRPA|nr:MULTISPECIES: stage V sporulation protein B [Virgibacillus]API90648.1 stage V sporulation protein B [Virgibacillus sp. 6R]KNE20602.1 stage V sporulation protein B [Virgibacillus pantothenticus]MBS7429769.1 stage V sporulation protein B [Virgibacillus sp. 19R1-5]MBU8565644.1 stage V sporulation protein B [Virgibacillus pantothenticus]MBU8601274.1 stage V sporulation protein B [Virgibacillus pantothenticus]
MTKQTFLQGTLILILAGMITRFLGFINRIVVARLIGEEGVGLYMMALPTFFLVITLTQLGLPVAISKRIAEAEARGDKAKTKQIVIVSLVITGISSIIFSTLMILATPFVATHLLTDQRTLYPLLAISPIIPIIAISSVLRGYFQGKQNMKPQSYAQVLEQVVRISCVALFVKLLLPFGLEYAAAGAMFSIILGELVSLIYMMRQFNRKKHMKVRKNFFSYLSTSRTTLKELFSIALPSTGSRFIASISHFLEPILVAQSLAIAGVSSTLATKQYGELTGYVLPLLFLPTFITQSLSVALVPSISEAEATKSINLIHYRIHQAIRISFASGAIATIVLTLFSIPILTYMYGSANASKFIILMAPFFILLYIQAPLQAALQALDLAKAAMWNSLIGAFCKLTVLFLLASNPSFGIMGVALAISLSVVLITLLHLGALYKAIKFSIPVLDILKMISLLLMTWGVGELLKNIYDNMHGGLLLLIGILGVFCCIYVLFLFLLRFITKEELKQIPFLQKWF